MRFMLQGNYCDLGLLFMLNNDFCVLKPKFLEQVKNEPNYFPNKFHSNLKRKCCFNFSRSFKSM